MATINYNGMELEEVTESQIFDPPKEMLVWDIENEASQKALVVFVLDKEKYEYPVRTVKQRKGGKYVFVESGFKHCAEIPDPPKPRRATNRELARWLIEGKAQIRHSDSDMVYVGWNYKEFEDDLPCSNDVLVRKWEDTEWHEPDVEYLGLEDVK